MSVTPTAPGQSHLWSYALINREADLMVSVLLNDEVGTAIRLHYHKGDEEFGFQSGDLTSATTNDGLRISVSLDTTAKPERSFSFELLLPVVTPISDYVGAGPIFVFAAGLRIEHFPDASFGPRQAIEPYPLLGAATVVAGWGSNP